MAICGSCGNDHEKTSEVLSQVRAQTFVGFEGAIHKLAPECAHCGQRILESEPEREGRSLCCEPCTEREGVPELRDRA